MSAYAELSVAKKELREFLEINGEPPYPKEAMETQYAILTHRIAEAQIDVNLDARLDAAAEYDARYEDPEDPGHGGEQ